MIKFKGMKHAEKFSYTLCIAILIQEGANNINNGTTFYQGVGGLSFRV